MGVPNFHLSTIATSGTETVAGSDVNSHAPTPDVAPIAAPASAPRSSSQPAGGDARQRPPAGTNAQQHARNAAAEVAYPNDNFGARTASSWPPRLTMIVGEGKGVDMSWQTRDAKCLGSSRWWSDDPNDETYTKAQCLTCPLLAPCQAHALEHEHFHVWGGLTASERRHVRNGQPVEQFLGKPSGRRRMGRPRKTVTVPMASDEHGTYAGYSQHVRRDEEPCGPCLLAKRAYQRQRTKGKAS